jgi:putative transposase
LNGQTPVLQVNPVRDKINVMGGLSWDGRVFAQVTTQKVTAEDTIAFLKYVLEQESGSIVMVLDNSRLHRNKLVSAFVAGVDRLEVEFLPSYAPELNPIELLWGWIKGFWLGNRVVKSVVELFELWRDGLAVVTGLPGLVQGFFGRLEKLLEISSI